MEENYGQEEPADHEEKIKTSRAKCLTILNAAFICFSLLVMTVVLVTDGHYYYVDEILNPALLLNPVFFILEIIAAKLSKGNQREWNLIFILANILLFLILFYFWICIWCSRG